MNSGTASRFMTVLQKSLTSAPLAGPTGGSRIESNRRFIAEEFTPLFYTREYATLPDAARLRYNQLHALYFNEQVAFFEQEMLGPALTALQRCDLPAELAARLKIFFGEEELHTAMFRALNRRFAPEFYATKPYYFIRVARPWRMLVGAMARRPQTFPLLIWLALLQEERSLHFSKGCLEQKSDLEPQFVATHRTHLRDEMGHIGWDEELLDWLWPRTGPALRAMNVRLLRWMLGEFFLLPKRSGRRVVEQLVRDFPQLDAAALFRGMRRLKTNPAYLKTLYSREITPRAFARFDAHPEFGLLAQTLPGYIHSSV
jgi:hypothetical protein